MSRATQDMDWNAADRIRELQKMLRCAGVYTGEETGVFDSDTKEAVRHFRMENGFSDEAAVDVAVWESLRNLCLRTRNEAEMPAGIFPFVPANRTVCPGERSDLVLLLQMMLNTLRLRYDQYGTLPLNGYYAEDMAAAVRAWRRTHLLPDGDCVDVIFWNRLAAEYNAVIQETE